MVPRPVKAREPPVSPRHYRHKVRRRIGKMTFGIGKMTGAYSGSYGVPLNKRVPLYAEHGGFIGGHGGFIGGR